ncbi:MAG: calcium-binding protein [Pseudomonadota bacterium]
MLFMMGLMGLMAVGTTVLLGDEDDDMPMPDEQGVEDGSVASDEITDLGSLIPDDEDPMREDSVADTPDAANALPEIEADAGNGDDLNDAIDPVEDALRDATEELPGPSVQDPTVEGLTGGIGDTLSDATDEIAEDTGGLVDEVTGLVDDTVEQVGDISEDYGTQVGGVVGDVIEGEEGNEFLLGYGGDDIINGNGGVDLIEGGGGNDILSGGAGADVLEGQDGDDLLSGDEGADTLAGGFGDDLLDGGVGDDSLQGGQGGDTLEGGEGDDALHGYHGDDVMRGGDGEDSLFGSLGDDILHGLSETGEDDGDKDYLNGGVGDDTITAGANDIVTAGDGADVIQFGDWNAVGGPAEVMDYQSAEDTLVVLYDQGTEEPELTFEQDSQNSDLYSVMADGQLIAQVHSATPVTAADITLVEQSAA